MAQLNVILLKYGLRKKLTLKGKHSRVIKDRFPECKYNLVYPIRIKQFLSCVKQIRTTHYWLQGRG